MLGTVPGIGGAMDAIVGKMEAEVGESWFVSERKRKRGENMCKTNLWVWKGTYSKTLMSIKVPSMAAQPCLALIKLGSGYNAITATTVTIISHWIVSRFTGLYQDSLKCMGSLYYYESQCNLTIQN